MRIGHAMATDLNLGDAMKAKHRKRGGRKAARCHVKEVRVKGRGRRFMLLCPHKAPKFISAGRAKSYRRGRR